MRRLKEISFSLTNRCNLRCLMCEIPAARAEELSPEIIKKTIADAAFIGAKTVSFSGGEPLLRDDIYELIAFAKSRGLDTALVSNGTMITPAVAQKLFAAGLDTARISIEGAQAVHDALRGEGSFVKTVAALESLKRWHIPVIVAATVSRYNFEHLSEVVEIARRYAAAMVQFQPFSPIFLRQKDRQSDFLIPKSLIPKLESSIRQAAALCASYAIATNPQSYLQAIPSYLSGMRMTPKDSCSALWESCPVSASGDIYPCWAIEEPEKKIGSLLEEPLCNLWLSDKHRLLKQEIAKKGCAGCMLSCYDRIFGQNKEKGRVRRLAAKALRIRSYRKLFGLLRQAAISDIARIRLQQRLAGFIKEKWRGKNTDHSEELGACLQEIARQKEKLRTHLNNLL